MTPKEKARTLTNKFAKIEPYLPTKDTILFMYEAKQCAIICVDTILNDVGAKDWADDDETKSNYWLDVKHEISLL